jgi:protein SCO1
MVPATRQAIKVPMLRVLQIALWAAAAMAVAAYAYLTWGRPAPSPEVAAARDAVALMNGEAEIGGPFSLVDQNGQPFTQANLIGRPTALFFGFTLCPDICPNTMAELSAARAALGPEADALQIVFVSVDPARDTPEILKVYADAFSQPLVALTGSPEAVDAMVRAYRVYVRQVPLEAGGYTVDHTSFLFLLDAQGQFVEIVRYEESVEGLTERLRALLR